MSEIIRNPANRPQNSVLPNTQKYPASLNREQTPGLQNLNEVLKLLTQNPTSRIVENATVLECVPYVGDLKSKYTLPHLNMKDGAVLEDYLLKIRDPIHDEGCKINPEELLIELKKLDKGSFSFFKAKNTPEQNLLIKQYYDNVSTHSTFAPKYSSGIMSNPPLPGAKVRIYYFQEPYISSGHRIAGLYESMYEDVFEDGFPEIKQLLEKFRQRYIQAALQAIADRISSNIPTVQIFGGSSDPTQVAGQVSGEFGNVSDASWPPVDVVAEHIGSPQSPNVETYNIVIDQFNVETNPRYLSRRLPSGQNATFCNIFVADVTWAMGTPVPWQVDENANPQPMAAKFKRGWMQLGAKGMFDWLKVHGPRYGWREVTAQEAQDNANKGLTTVATTERHIAMIRPGTAGTDKFGVNPRTAQAGFSAPRSGRNNILLSEAGPGFRSAKYYTCFSSSRYVSPTQEQVDRLSTTVGETTTPEGSFEQQQQNPEQNSYEENLPAEEQTSVEQ
jgi:hypothetical protein